MGVLKEKSDQSFKTASFLISEKLYNPSVHCSYYSCIQLILDVFHEKFSISESTLTKEAKEFMGINRVGSHNFYMAKIRKFLNDKGTAPIEINNWHNNLVQLKQKRENSDYSRIHCVQGEAELAKQKAKDVREFLNRIFK
jgi:hypothetical protein